MSSKFLLDKIISLEDLNLINQCSLGNKQNTIYHHSNFPSMTTNLPHKIQNTQKKIFRTLKFSRSILDIAQWNILGIIRFCQGLTKRETIGVYINLQNINDEIIQLQFRGECNYPEHKGGKCYFVNLCEFYVCVKQYVCVCVCLLKKKKP